MSRSGYIDDCDDYLQLGRWRGRVKSALNGRRGQQFLKDALAALDAMPDKRLVQEELITEPDEETGETDVCTLGAVLVAKHLPTDKLDPEDHAGIGQALNIAPCLVAEVEYENDEGGWRETPEQRWERMRRWIVSMIKQDTTP